MGEGDPKYLDLFQHMLDELHRLTASDATTEQKPTKEI
jgi:hypothetical protein